MKPKILLIDIETSPILGYVWGLWKNDLGLSQIAQDWSILAWSAKWLGEANNKTKYMDQRNAKDINDDKKILKEIWKLLDECDIVVSHNGKRFDSRRLNARFVQNGMKPPSPYQHIDTLKLSRKHFDFTSHKLEYLSTKLNKKYKKSSHGKFAGMSLWVECLAGNKEAWKEMEKYNKQDVFALEELYNTISPWDKTINFALYEGGDCNCDNPKLVKDGHAYTSTGKYQRYKCGSCGARYRDRKQVKGTMARTRIDA